MPHATGTFEVTITPEAEAAAPPGGVPMARMSLAKSFAGALAGTASGIMLSGGTLAPGQAAAYVAIDQFHGTLDGRAGGFMLVHMGSINRAGARTLSIAIAPDSGTGALAGISGMLAISLKDGRHHYDLSYHLPEN